MPDERPQLPAKLEMGFAPLAGPADIIPPLAQSLGPLGQRHGIVVGHVVDSAAKGVQGDHRAALGLG